MCAGDSSIAPASEQVVTFLNAMRAGDSSGSRRPLLTRRTRPSLPQVVTFDAADFGAVVPYALAARPDGARVDLVLAPLSAGGAACRRGD